VCDSLQAWTIPRQDVCLSVSVAYQYCVEMVHHIIKLFHHQHSSFSTPNVMAIFQRRPSMGASNAGDMKKIMIFDQLMEKNLTV